MSTTTPSDIQTPAPVPAPATIPPNPLKDYAAFVAWAVTPEGQAYFADLNKRLVEQRGRDGEKATNVVAVTPTSI